MTLMNADCFLETNVRVDAVAGRGGHEEEAGACAVPARRSGIGSVRDRRCRSFVTVNEKAKQRSAQMQPSVAKLSRRPAALRSTPDLLGTRGLSWRALPDSALGRRHVAPAECREASVLPTERLE